MAVADAAGPDSANVDGDMGRTEVRARSARHGPGHGQRAVTGWWRRTEADAGRGARLTPEQIPRAAEKSFERKWRLGLSMDIFKDLRKMYNDAGVTIYAVKDVRQGSDEELEYTFAVAQALGADHITLELPSGPNAMATLKRLGDWGVRKKINIAYHPHAQGSMTAFDQAFAISPANMANVDLGHCPGGNRGGTPLDFLNKHHGRISSYHLKDRTTPANCSLNLAWGTGETPIKEILQPVRKNRWTFPASIKLGTTSPKGYGRGERSEEVRGVLPRHALVTFVGPPGFLVSAREPGIVFGTSLHYGFVRFRLP